MVVFFALVVLAAILAALGLAALAGERTRAHSRRDEALHDTLGTLDYAVPEGQDPSVLLAALGDEGYRATVDVRSADQHVLIECPGGTDRERPHVREVLAHADRSAMEDGGPVPGTGPEIRFADE